MPDPEILEFGEKLVREVRDVAIQSCDLSFQANAQFPAAARWKEALKNDSPEVFAKMLIADVVDEAIASLLQAIDQGDLNLSYTSSSGKLVNLEKNGRSELTGWYTKTHGWREKFSKERFFDDFADLDPQ